MSRLPRRGRENRDDFRSLDIVDKEQTRIEVRVKQKMPSPSPC